jgi:tripartite-type tricarboxylate transporter receptor subunit TctC
VSRAASELYKVRSGVPGVGVGYQGTPDALRDMMGGQIDYIIGDATFMIEQEKAGKLRLLAVTTKERAKVTPQLPSTVEAGVPDFDLRAWWAVWLPANAPKDVVDKLAGWFKNIVASEETRKFLAGVGSEPFPGDAKAVHDMTVAEIAKWGEIIRLAKIEPQ